MASFSTPWLHDPARHRQGEDDAVRIARLLAAVGGPEALIVVAYAGDSGSTIVKQAIEGTAFFEPLDMLADPDDPRFPTLRNFDAANGFSWASGPASPKSAQTRRYSPKVK